MVLHELHRSIFLEQVVAEQVVEPPEQVVEVPVVVEPPEQVAELVVSPAVKPLIKPAVATVPHPVVSPVFVLSRL